MCVHVNGHVCTYPLQGQGVLSTRGPPASDPEPRVKLPPEGAHELGLEMGAHPVGVGVCAHQGGETQGA